MKYRSANADSQEMRKVVSKILTQYSGQLYSVTQSEFDLLVEYDTLMILSIYGSRVDESHRSTVCGILSELLDIDDSVLDNEDNLLTGNSDYVPLSCVLLDRIGDSMVTRLAYETLFVNISEAIISVWNHDDSYSNYLALMNAAYFKQIGPRLHQYKSYKLCMLEFYEADDFDTLVNHLYEQNRDNYDWDVDVDLDLLEKELQSSKYASVEELPEEKYTDAIRYMDELHRKAQRYADATDDITGFARIKKRTGIVELQAKDIHGFECHFCQNSKNSDAYIIIYQKEQLISELMESDQWAQFQHDVYYADIEIGRSAGMVYIIYILDENSTNIPIQVIESNKTYGRKYVFTEEETITFINGIVRTTNEEMEASSPVQEWDRILREAHLTGCMVEPYAKKKVEQYLNGYRFDAAYDLDDDYAMLTTSDIPCVKWVKSLDTYGFRDFCFNNRRLDFGQINLFHGANGSGKTSVLEAIEYALTAEVRRVKDFKVKLPSNDTPLLKVYDRQAGIHTFTPGFAKRNNKEIERVWYGVPIGRTKCNLNENFNRFNSFDSEAAYKFIHESDNSEDSYATMFGNLIFGESVVDHEKKWTRFKKAFDDIYSELRSELNDAKFSIGFYEQCIAQRDDHNRSETVEKFLTSLKYKAADKLPKETDKRYKELLDGLQRIRKYVDVLESNDTGCDTFDELTRAVADIKVEASRSTKKKKELNAEISEITERIGALKQKIYDEQDTQKELDKRLRDVNVDIKNWTIVQNVLSHEDTIQLAEQLAEESGDLDRDLYYISKIEQRTALVSFLATGSYERLDANEYQSILEKYEALKGELQSLNAEYEDAKKRYGEKEQQSIELRRLGKLLAVDHKCPLCGHEYNSTDALLEIIEAAVIVDDSVERLLDEIQDKQRQIDRLEKNIDRERLIDCALADIDALGDDIPVIRDHRQDYRTIYLYLESKKDKIKRKSEIVEQQNVLINQGFSLENIRACKNYTSMDVTYLAYKKSDSKHSYDAYLALQLEKVQLEYAKSVENIRGYEKEIEDGERRIDIAKNEIRQIEQAMDGLDLDGNRELEQALGMVTSRFAIDAAIAMDDWFGSFHELYDQCELEAERQSESGMMSFERTQLSEYKQKEERLEPMVDRCQIAVQTFAKMPTLSSMVDQQLGSKIHTISSLFTRMHHSHEFKSLDIDEEGLFAIRSLDGEKIRIYEMSTGQRATIAMAVMFTLHMSAKDAPRFLLLDEPLATMDDIQVKDVLDILEEMAREGTQIFFTSANGIMINLFKEHFKNTDYDYKEYQFIKRVNMPSEIKETSINDTRTIEELSLDDLTLDFNQFAEIRRILRNNQRKLVPEEEWDVTEDRAELHQGDVAGAEDTTPVDENSFLAALSGQERMLLNILSTFGNASASQLQMFLSAYPTYRTICENINEKAIDYYGETIIDNDDVLPTLSEDYEDEIAEMFAK